MDDERRTIGAVTAPRLLTGHGLQHRADGGVQLGTEPCRGLVLDGLTPDDLQVLTRIDGRSTRDDLTAHPTRAGVTSTRASQLIDLLSSAGLLVERATTSGYRGQVVLVDGSGPVSRALAGHLADLGVGTIRSGPYAVDASDAAGARPDLVVVVGPAPVAPSRVGAHRTRGIRHLVVAISEAAATVGPLVTPGRTPCLECLELHRADRDPGRATLPGGPSVGSPELVVCEPALAALAAGLAAAVVAAALADQCPGGVTLEVGLPWPQVVQRQWSGHPGCRCGAPCTTTAPGGRQWSA